MQGKWNVTRDVLSVFKNNPIFLMIFVKENETHEFTINFTYSYFFKASFPFQDWFLSVFSLNIVKLLAPRQIEC